MASSCQDELSAAAELLERAESLQNGHQGSILQQSSTSSVASAKHERNVCRFYLQCLLESSIILSCRLLEQNESSQKDQLAA